jgi:small subunit ribosomal protein S9
MIDDERPEQGGEPEEAAGDEPLNEVEDAGEEVSEAPESPAADDEPAPDAPNESAPGHVDPDEVKDAEPSAEAPPEDAPNESATGDAQPAAEAGEPAAEGGEPEAAAGDEPEAERPRRERRPRDRDDKGGEEVVPGAHLEPDLVLEETRAEGEGDEFADRYAPATDAPTADGDAAPETEPEAGEAPAERPAPRTALDLAADARYQATGKRKTSVARVILKPGDGAYTVNGRSLEDYFPRAALQKAARQPLQTAGFEKRMDVAAKIHGGGISAQAGALRHGVARALVEADPSLRVELKRRGYLSRDDRAKERKKAGLKKARKRPQFSKR